eukprot:TRINITY_DN61319_c0_g1_i1.p1 TRINITY_DN61319_c0_g1~~TRINITY_DN61319_c0_g1_i1.p1  ORF type:complete len:156 (-),score=41.09 TRINITY_DN61319_c0_g1_i1:145-612(-)
MTAFSAFWLSCFLVALVHASTPSKQDGKAFLVAKESQPGVIKLPSGLMYKVLEKGTGKTHPKEDTPCKVSYAGQLINGEQFDASDDITFAPNQVIAGWTEAMQLMVEGDKWELYIPSGLAYGEQGAGGEIPPGAVLVFQMKLKKIGGGDYDQAEA